MKKNLPYAFSKDYKRLRELLDKGYSIICYADYNWSDGDVLRDICEARKRPDSEGDSYGIGARGISYVDYFPFHTKKYGESFEQHCQSANIEFIDIENI